MYLFQFGTRKSSCENARGIPTAAYQVLHLLTEVGNPPPPSGSPHPGLMGGTWGGVSPHWGSPLLGYPSPIRVPPIGVPHQGTPQLDLAQVPPPAGPGSDPPTRCEQTENITFPHPSDAVGKYTDLPAHKISMYQ